jgi:predicted HD phosphohydrolase
VLVPGDDAGHGRHAAAAVLDLLGPRVAALVEAHVPAKRYLVASSAGYERKLSAVSEDTLGRQGGPMSVAEAAAFRATPDFADALVLRHADDAAKVYGRLVLGLDYWCPLVERVARRAAAGAGQKVPVRTGPLS